MTIVHTDSIVLRIWPLENDIENSSYDTQKASPQIPIEVISVTDLNTTFFEEVRNSYTQDRNCSILCQLLTKDSKDNSLIHSLDEIWKISYDEGIVHLIDGIIYHRTKHKWVMKIVDRSLINLVSKECHYNLLSGHLSEDRKRERIKTCILWPVCKKMFQNIAKPVTDVKIQINPLAKDLEIW
ncbi:hypothetical protein O181_097922 [Austropuccinia psidii MF-1]|uniref:Uncharacterized protein n=1 Tax=Austropuccinia psidii MF-1 TaxID=1389203 RepID=A0A9Q3J9F2_9BASI|nr:hypothetical protein [Austropuccinia psidii MF-1]